MRRSSSIKSDIEKIKKLRALQEKATDKLNKITEKAAGITRKKKTAKAATKTKAKAGVKKGSILHRVFGKKSKPKKKSKPLKTRNKKTGKKGPGSQTGGNSGFMFRHFGRG